MQTGPGNMGGFESKLFKFHDVQLCGFYVNLLTESGTSAQPLVYTDGISRHVRKLFGC